MLADRNLPDLHEGSEVMLSIRDSDKGDKKRATRIEVLPAVRRRNTMAVGAADPPRETSSTPLKGFVGNVAKG